MRTFKLFFIGTLLLIFLPQISKGQAPVDPTVWKFKTSGPVYSTPLIQNDTLFIGSLDSCFYAIDILTGQQLWKHKTKSKINTTASIYENTIIFGSGNYLYGLDLNGNYKWEFEMYTGTAVIQNDDWDYFNSSPRLVDSIAYIGTENNKVYGVNVKNGLKVFECQGTDGNYTVETTPVIYNGKVFFGNWNGVFYAYDLKTEQKVWVYDTKNDNKYADWVNAIVTNPVIYNDNIYFGGRSCNLYCFDSETGSKIWKYHDSGDMWLLGGPIIQDSTLYLGSSYQKVIHSFNALKGTINWKTQVDNLSYGTPLVDTTYLFAGTGDDPGDKSGSLFAIDKKTGVVKTKYSIDGRIQSSPALYKDNIYFGSSNGYVYAINKHKFANVNLPKIELKVTKPIAFGKVEQGAVLNTSIYVSNVGAASDSVKFSSSRTECTVTPGWAIINPGDSVKVDISINTTSLSAKKYSIIIYAYSNYSPFHENLRRTISYEITSPVGFNKLQTNENELIQFPNPVKEYGTVQYNLDRNTNICLSVYDATGKQIMLLDKGYRTKGIHQVIIGGINFYSGIYFCRLTTDEYSKTKKMIVVK